MTPGARIAEATGMSSGTRRGCFAGAGLVGEGGLAVFALGRDEADEVIDPLGGQPSARVQMNGFVGAAHSKLAARTRP